MALEPEIIEWMKDTVTIEPFIDEDAYSQPVWGPPDTYAAFIDYRQRFIRDMDGNQVTSMSKVSVNPRNTADTATLAAPSVRSRLTLPASASYPSGQVVQIMSVAYPKDPDDGTVHHFIFYA